ncbi:AMP-binding protein [Marinomonas sp. RSW2]|uniref:AMP-binding protein n=1 Tax=Marinomonas maritima TaxID=2940935 RepID=A0ABT5WBH4_9GAMM|nr:AMP-binding protein [Marinomonas maritima]MDE8602171.1 AMP-binding protein [Marinomonas maritima]
MSVMEYSSFFPDFRPAMLAPQALHGDLEKGLNVCDEVCDRWATDTAKIALYYQALDGTSGTLTFAELSQQAARFANYLTARGIGKGDRVAGLLPRGPELLIVIMGTLKAGAVYQPLFTAFGPSAIDYRLTQAGTRLVVTNGENYPKLEAIQTCPPIICVDPLDAQGVDDFGQLMAQQSTSFTPVLITADEAFLQMFTSGTVGKAKAVTIPAKALLSFYVYMKYAIELQEQDSYWNMADPGWAYGLYYAVIGPLLLGHSTHFNEAGFTPESTYQMIEKYGISNLAAAPTVYRMLMANDDLLPAAKSFGLRVASSAGEPLNPEVLNWVGRRLDCPVMDHYGQTETGMTCCNFHALAHSKRIGSMGYAMPGYRMVALDEAFNEVAAGETGQLAVDVAASSLFFFDGYGQSVKSPFHGQYYLTGDMVLCHEDGGFSFTGRDDDIITTAGYRVGPADVESCLLEHPAVAESGVVAKPDAKRGAIIKAFVVLKAHYMASDALAGELKTLVRNRLSTHAFPREITFMEALPKTPSGKIQRFILRQTAEAEVAEMA